MFTAEINKLDLDEKSHDTRMLRCKNNYAKLPR